MKQIDATRHLFRMLLALSVALFSSAALALDVGALAPVIALPDAKGETVGLDKLRGQVVYVDFWASWCGPCKRSFPWMNEMQQKYGGKGLAIIAINVDKKREDADRFLRQVTPTFAVVYDGTGAAPAAFGVKTMPSSYLIDARGTIVEVEQGFHDERKGALEERIRALVAAR
jgi:cytochrome c biogenesis protein CcmG, thiol:disulfide interchange protein DsbE